MKLAHAGNSSQVIGMLPSKIYHGRILMLRCTDISFLTWGVTVFFAVTIKSGTKAE
jgi:hypothetical protein